MPRIRRRRPLVRGAVVGGAGYAIGKKKARDQQRMNDVEAEAKEAKEMTSQPRPAAPQATSATSEEDRIEKLKELASLRDSGVLTEEEFQQEKKRLLGGA